MYDKSLEQLIDAVIADGIITDQERNVVYKKAATLGIDQDEIEVYLNGRLDTHSNAGKPKSGKHGIVKICPNCGAPLIGGLAKCPECGYTISNVSANSSAILLDKRLQKGLRSERANIIRSFPIPNTRDDLMEFLSALEPKALVRPKGEEYEKKETKAYYEKYVECLNKARISFGDDAATKMFQSNLARYKKQRHYIIGLIIVLGVIILGCLIGAIVYGVQHEKSRTAAEFAQKEALQEEYDAWEASVTSEIEAYSDSLSKELDKIPAPTVSNWEKCGQMWNRIAWTKKWTIPSKFKNIISGYENPNYTHKKTFVDKKNNIGEMIKKAHQQVLMNKGMEEHEAHNATVDEFYELDSWIEL